MLNCFSYLILLTWMTMNKIHVQWVRRYGYFNVYTRSSPPGNLTPNSIWVSAFTVSYLSPYIILISIILLAYASQCKCCGICAFTYYPCGEVSSWCSAVTYGNHLCSIEVGRPSRRDQVTGLVRSENVTRFTITTRLMYTPFLIGHLLHENQKGV